jgi:hypothetical protein
MPNMHHLGIIPVARKLYVDDDIKPTIEVKQKWLLERRLVT